MNYKQLTEKNKVEIDILLKQNLSMREVGRRLGISHSTISRYKSGKYKKRKIDINKRYPIFIKYIMDHYDRRHSSIEVCVYKFNKSYKYAPSVTVKQVYNWINNGKIELTRNKLCYKRYKKRKRSGMMEHFKWNLEHKTILPISLRPKYIEKRTEPGHLEIDSILGKKDEQQAIISIVDRCTRRLWLIKAEYRYDYYTANLIYKYIIKNGIEAIETKGLINIIAEINNNQASIKISNNGKMIPEAKQNEIFNEGYTTKSTGCGLGLHICKTQLEKQKANIRWNKSTKTLTEFEISISTV